LFARRPDLAKRAIDIGLAARYPLLLSGFAVPKSIAGDIGAAINVSAKQRSLNPLRQLFSRETLRDVKQAFREPLTRGTHELSEIASRQADDPIIQRIMQANLPGRVMGAFDIGTRRALQRVGLTPEQAATEVLQNPIPAEYAKALSGRVGRFGVPFQRTGFNVVFGGLDEMQKNPAIAAAAAGAGFGTGEVTDDPIKASLMTPLAGRNALSFALGTIASRVRQGGQRAGEQAAFGLSPIGDETFVGPIARPLRSFERPAYLSVLKFLGLRE
jgi:hypothetical protein